jgi:UPF0755 protein
MHKNESRIHSRTLLQYVGFSLLTIFLISAVIISFLYVYLNTPPDVFPTEKVFEVHAGTSVRSIGHNLYEQGFVRSSLYFYLIAVLHNDPKNIKASSYIFEKPLSTSEIINRLIVGDFTADLITITLPEGITLRTMADILEASELTSFDKAAFLQLTQEMEGVLFPDTYFVPKDFTTEEIIALLNTTHTQKIAEIRSVFNSSFSDNEVVILASILEREANTLESKKMVSGILQNRLRISMPLQADATIEYVLSKPLNQLVPSDLQMDSPYNTYLNRGLPPTPIGNPGQTALEAVFNPTNSNFLFYITGNDGKFYYAEDFDTHRLNIARYLR